MTRSNDFLPYDADALPAGVARYLSAQDDARARGSVVDVFAPHAHVTDEGVTYEGEDAIRRWLTTVATEYTYTTTLIGQRSDGLGQWVVLARLEGDFPGGVAVLRFEFTVQDDRISALAIAP